MHEMVGKAVNGEVVRVPSQQAVQGLKEEETIAEALFVSGLKG